MSEAGKSLFLTQSIIKGHQSYFPTNTIRLPSHTLKTVAASRRGDSYHEEKRRRRDEAIEKKRREEAIRKERRDEAIRKERKAALIRKEKRRVDPIQKEKRGDNTLKKERLPRTRSLVSVSPVAGRVGDWGLDQTLSLKALQLGDLLEDGEQKDAEVHVSLTVQEHAGFGLSVKGRVTTSFTRICSNCSSPYCREIDETFHATVLSSKRVNRESGLPEIGGDDPSVTSRTLFALASTGTYKQHNWIIMQVMYVKPGDEATLDPLVQESIRLTIHGDDTCSELCEKSDQSVIYTSVERTNTIDMRWSKLLELKQRMSQL